MSIYQKGLYNRGRVYKIKIRHILTFVLVFFVLFGAIYLFLNIYYKSLNFANLIKNNNIREVSLYLKIFGPEKIADKISSETNYSRNCNTYLFQLGKISYSVFKNKSIDEYIFNCNSGYMQGAISEYIKESGLTNSPSKVNYLCQNYKTTFEKLECYHAAGNGFMIASSYDLPKAIEMCGEFSTSGKKGSCYFGVFMQNNGSTMIGGRNIETHWLSDDPNFPCQTFEQNPEALRACYMIHFPYRVAQLSKSTDPAAILSSCLSLPNVDLVRSCIYGYGIYTAVASNYSPNVITLNCAKISNNNYHSLCLSGAEASFIDFWGRDANSKGVNYCRNFAGADNKACLQNLNNTLKLIN